MYVRCANFAAMSLPLKLSIVGLFAMVTTNLVICQKMREETRIIQFSVSPALGTNGLQPGSFANKFSVNLTSGYSARNLLFEVGTFSNLNTNGTHGLQVAGLANITGGNTFAGLLKKEKEQKLRTGFNSHLAGAQFSGLTNIVVDEIFGMQLTGGLNLGKNALFGCQVAGGANVIYKYSFGVQIAGLWNTSIESMDGVQISGLMNYTSGALYGVQLAAINSALYTEGKNSVEKTHPWGAQIGLFNKAETMNGFQVGLINFSKHSQGTQIGLINIYRHGKTTGTKDGTAIGLVNIGDVGYLSTYSTELFALNYEIATGNSKNRRVKLDTKNVYWENSLLYAHQPFHQGAWAMGYGVKKMFFTRSLLPGMSEFRFLSYGMDVQHVSFRPNELANNLSLLTRAKIEIGTRLAPKLFGLYIFGGVTYNAFWTDSSNTLAPSFLRISKQNENQLLEFWPGFVFGVMIH